MGTRRGSVWLNGAWEGFNADLGGRGRGVQILSAQPGRVGRGRVLRRGKGGQRKSTRARDLFSVNESLHESPTSSLLISPEKSRTSCGPLEESLLTVVTQQLGKERPHRKPLGV